MVPCNPWAWTSPFGSVSLRRPGICALFTWMHWEAGGGTVALLALFGWKTLGASYLCGCQPGMCKHHRSSWPGPPRHRNGIPRPRHRNGILSTHNARGWFNAPEFKVLPWPPPSLNFNPTEHLWDELERGASSTWQLKRISANVLAPDATGDP